MKNVGSISEVAIAFVQDHDGPNRNTRRTFFFEKNILYSYGSHFPLCVRTEYKEKEFFLLNGDRYSSTTAQHRNGIRSYLKNRTFCTVSASAIRGINRNRSILRELRIVDFTEDLRGYVDDKNPLPKNLPEGTEISHDKNGDPTSYHRAGTLLFEFDGRTFLCGMDDGSYFVSELLGKAKSVEKAFVMLKPDRVINAKSPVMRQGEWFFIEAETDPKQVRKMLKFMEPSFSLPHLDGGNPHTVTRGCRISIKARDYLVSGSVRHHQHRTLRLNRMDDPKLFLAVRNTAVNNWSAAGTVD